MASSRTARDLRSGTTSRRRLALAALLVTPLLAACGSGFHAQTDEVYQPGPGITVRDGGVFVLNALIVTDGSNHGTLVAALINQQDHPDTLATVSVTGPDPSLRSLSTTILSRTIALPSQRSVQLAQTADVRVEGNLVAGAYYRLSLTFRHAAPVSTELPVVSQTADFRDVTVGPTPPATTPSHANP